MFKYITAINISVFIVQTEEVVTMNGEKIENASEEEESEEVDSEETEEPVSAIEETSEPISQVRTENYFLRSYAWYTFFLTCNTNLTFHQKNICGRIILRFLFSDEGRGRAGVRAVWRREARGGGHRV